MAPKIYWIKTFSNEARLGIMARPRGNEWLEDEILGLKKQKVTAIVSLLESEEIAELGIIEEKEFCRKCGIDFLNYPIVDRGIPAAGSRLETFIQELLQKIEHGASVVIHCRMGIGRSSIIAGSILLLKGENTDTVLRLISSARGLKVPDTDEQVKWLKKREK